MFMLKVAIYCATIGAAMFFAFWELRLKRQLTDGALRPVERGNELEVMSNLAERIRREQVLGDLSTVALSKLRCVMLLKFLFVAILIIEVIVLQR